MNYNIHPDWNNFFETHNDDLNNIFIKVDNALIGQNNLKTLNNYHIIIL